MAAENVSRFFGEQFLAMEPMGQWKPKKSNITETCADKTDPPIAQGGQTTSLSTKCTIPE